MDFMTIIGDLVQAVGDAWERRGWREDAFPTLAYDALASSGLASSWSLDEFLSWMSNSGAMPSQLDPFDKFGEPPVTLRWHPTGRFLVDVYFWTKVDLQIHDHSFAGACLLLQGESLNCEYDFLTREHIGPDLSLGDISLKTARRLVPSDCFAISSGRALRHRVWHVARPTVSLVVRSLTDARIDRQWGYLEPGLAINCAFNAPPILAKHAALCRTLREVGDPRWRAVFSDIVAVSDLHTAVWTVIHSNDTKPDEELVARSIEILTARHGRSFAFLADVARHRAERAAMLPTALTDQGDRFFLATLLSLGPTPAASQMLEARGTGGGRPAAVEQRLRQIESRLAPQAARSLRALAAPWVGATGCSSPRAAEGGTVGAASPIGGTP